MYINIYMYTFTCKNVYSCIYIYIFTYTYIHIYMYKCIYIYISTHTFSHAHVRTNTHLLFLSHTRTQKLPTNPSQQAYRGGAVILLLQLIFSHPVWVACHDEGGKIQC